MQWDESSLSHTDVMLDLPAKHTEMKEKVYVREGHFAFWDRGNGNGEGKHGANNGCKENVYDREATERGKEREGKNGMHSTSTKHEIGVGPNFGKKTFHRFEDGRHPKF